MTLTKCKECGNDVSSSAATCPKCGAKVPKKMAIGLLVISGFAVWFFNSVFTGPWSIATKSSGDSLKSVIYRVDGSASRASLTYNNEQGGTQQENVTIPWYKTFVMKPGTFLYISAQNQGSAGNVIVVIDVDGTDAKRSESRGEYSIASAQMRCCN